MMESGIDESGAVRRNQRAFTLMEMLISLAVLAIIMIPIVAWTLLVFQRTEETRPQDEATEFAALSRTFARDVQASGFAALGGAVCGTGTVDAASPIADVAVALQLETTEVESATEETFSKVITQYIVKPEAPAGETGVLWRRRCVNPTDPDPARRSTVDTRLVGTLKRTSPATPLENRFAQFQCLTEDQATGVTTTTTTSIPGGGGDIDPCQVVEARLEPNGRQPVTLRASRRPDTEPTADQKPRPVIICAPSCDGIRERDANGVKRLTIGLDGSRSRNVDAYLWNFGDGTTSTSPSPGTKVYVCSSATSTWNPTAKECRWTVSLTVVGGTPKRAARATVTVVAKNAVPQIVVTPTAVNEFRTRPVQFDASTSSDADGVLSYAWNFGDPALGSANNSNLAKPPPVLYTGILNTTATVTITDDDGVAQTISIPVVIANHPPVAQYTNSKSVIELCAAPADCNSAEEKEKRTVIFDGQYNPTRLDAGEALTYDPDGSADNRSRGDVDKYQWSMLLRNSETDSATPLNTKPSTLGTITVSGSDTQGLIKVVFPSLPGLYEITLRVTDRDGREDTARLSLSANAQPRAVIDPTPASLLVQYPSLRFTLDGSRSFDPDSDPSVISSYNWSISPKGSSTPVFTENGPDQVTVVPPLAAGRYVARLRVADRFGSLSPIVDGRSFPGKPAARTTVELKVNKAPTIVMPTGLDVRRLKPFTFTVNQSGSATVTDQLIDPGDRVVSYTWSFRRVSDNALLATETNTTGTTTQTFAGTPQIRAWLQATDNDGAISEASVVFNVTNQSPQSSFSVAPSSGIQGHDPETPARFTFRSAAQDVDGSIGSCQWTFQDPTQPGGQRVVTDTACTDATGPITYDWTTSGVFEVRLRTFDNEGLVNVMDAVRTVEVRRKPVACFTPNTDPLKVSNGASINYSASCSNDNGNPGGAITETRWIWDDGTPDNLAVNPTKNWQRSNRGVSTGVFGQFQMRLVVTNRFGLTDTKTVFVTINSPPYLVINGVQLASDAGVDLRINCPTIVSGFTVRCNVPSGVIGGLNATGSTDPDGAGAPTFGPAPLPGSRISWFRGNNVTPPAASTGVIPTGFTFDNTEGNLQIIKVQGCDADGACETARMRMVINRRPTNVTIGSGTNFQLGRNAPTTPSQVFTSATDADGDALTYLWTFTTSTGEVYTSTARDPIVTIPGPGFRTGTINLTVTDALGLSVSAPTQNFTTVDAKPVGVISTPSLSPGATRLSDRVVVLNSGGASTMTVSFTAAGSTDPDGNQSLGLPGVLGGIQSYSWSLAPVWGTGTIAPSTPNPPTANAGFTRTFSTSTGSTTWRLTLTVSDYSVPAQTSTTTLLIRMNRPPIATWACPAVKADSSPAAVTFTNSSTDPDGGVNGVAGTPAQMRWDFGDGSPVATVPWAATVTKTYSAAARTVFPVTMTVIDADGTEASVTCPTAVLQHRKPVAVPTASLTRINASTTNVVTLGSAGSFDPDANTPPNFGIADADRRWKITDPSGGITNLTGATQTYTFPRVPGVYNVELTVTDADGSSSSPVALTVTVNTPPIAVIANQSLAFQRGQIITVSGAGSRDPDNDVPPTRGIASYRWEFRSETGVLLQTVVTANSTADVILNKEVPNLLSPPGSSGTATLVVTDSAGETSVAETKPFTVFNVQPVARITSTPANAAGNTLALSSSTSTDSDGSVAGWQWEIRRISDNALMGSATTRDVTINGAVPPASTATNFVLVAGNYRATLVVTDDDGRVSTVDLINGGNLPPATLDFRVQGKPVARIVSNPVNTTFQGPEARRVSFSASTSTDPDNAFNQLTFLWTVTDRFGNVFATAGGENFNDVDFIGLGLNRVILTVTDPDGLVDTSVKEVILNSVPVPKVTPTPLVRNEGGSRSFSFDPVGTNDPDGTITTYEWSFLGTNGTTVLGTATGSGVKTFDFPAAAGTYFAELKVTDNDGGVATKRASVRINTKPTALLQPGGFALERNVAFALDGSLSTDPDSATPAIPAGIANYRWEFFNENGVSIRVVDSPSPQTSVTFANVLVPATQGGNSGQVRLTVTDTDGLVSTMVPSAFTVSNGKPVAVATIQGGGLVDVASFTRTLRHSFSSDPDGTLTSFRWQIFLNGSTTPLIDETRTTLAATVNYTFATSGSYEVRLTVTDNDGATDTTSRTVKANQRPIAGIKDSSAPFSASAGVARTFDGSSPAYSSDADGTVTGWAWTFRRSDGSIAFTASGATPSVTFPTAGSYSVSLTVTDNDGATSVAGPSYNITVT